MNNNNITFENRVAAGTFTLAALQNPDEGIITTIFRDRTFVYSEELLRTKMSSVGRWFFSKLTSLYTFFQKDTVHDLVRTIIAEYLQNRSETNFNNVSSEVIANMKMEGQPNPWMSEDQVRSILETVKQQDNGKLLIANDFKFEVLKSIKKAILENSSNEAEVQTVFNRVFYRGVQSFNSSNWTLFQKVVSQVLPIYEDRFRSYLGPLEKTPENRTLAQEYARTIVKRVVEGLRLSVEAEVKVDASSYINEAIDDAKRKIVNEFKIYLPQFDESMRNKILVEFNSFAANAIREQNSLDRHHPNLQNISSRFLEWISNLKKEEMHVRFYTGEKVVIFEEPSLPVVRVNFSLLTAEESQIRLDNVNQVSAKIKKGSEICGEPKQWLTDVEIDRISLEIIDDSPLELYETELTQQALLDEIIKRVKNYIGTKLSPHLALMFKKVVIYQEETRESYKFYLSEKRESLDENQISWMEEELKKTPIQLYKGIWVRFHTIHESLQRQFQTIYTDYQYGCSREIPYAQLNQLSKNYAESLIKLLATKGEVKDFYDYKAFDELISSCIDLKKRQALLFFRNVFISRIPQEISKPVRAILIRDFVLNFEKFMNDYSKFDIHIVEPYKIDYLCDYFLNPTDLGRYVKLYSDSPEAIHAMKWLELQDKQTIPIFVLDFLYLLRDKPNKLQYLKDLIPHAAQLLSELHQEAEHVNAKKYYTEILTSFFPLLKEEQLNYPEPYLNEFLNELRENKTYIPEEAFSSILPNIPRILEITDQPNRPDFLGIRSSMPEYEAFLALTGWFIKNDKGNLGDYLHEVARIFDALLNPYFDSMKNPKDKDRLALHKILVMINTHLQSAGVGLALGAVGVANGVDKSVNAVRNAFGFESKYSDQQIIDKILGWVNGLTSKFLPKNTPKPVFVLIEFITYLFKGIIKNHRLIPFITCFASFRSFVHKLEKVVDPKVKLDDQAINGLRKEYNEFCNQLIIAVQGMLQEAKQNTFEGNCLNAVQKALKEFKIDMNDPNYLAQMVQRIAVPVAESSLRMPGLLSGREHEQLAVTFLDEVRLSQI